MHTMSLMVITLNRKDKLKRCLESLQRITYPHREILVLDNGSSDGSAGMVRSEFPGVTLIEEPENIGAGSGRNKLAAHAKGNILVFMDDDEHITDPQIGHHIASYFEDAHHKKVVVFSILDAEGNLFKNYIPRFDKKEQQEDSPCACLLAGGFAIRKSFFEETGGFWPMLDPYGYEDRELGFRLLAAGAEMVWSRQITIHHDKEEDPNFNATWARYMLPHLSWVAIRHLPWRYVLSYVVHSWPYFALQSLRRGLIWPYAQSIAHFFCGLPTVLRSRKTLSKDVIRYCQMHSGRLRY